MIIGIIIVATIGVVGYYDPITNPPTFSHTFRTRIDYSGGWKEIDYVYPSVGKPSPGNANYTAGTSLGYGSSTGTFTATGLDKTGLTLCIVAEKLDSSNATLILGIDGMTNETSLPNGQTTVCEGATS